MGVFEIALILSTFLCSLVAGFLFAFVFVVMPGIGTLNDREFIRAFQKIDGVIQSNQPVFILVWVGSALVLAASTLLGLWELTGAWRAVLIIATLVYLLGVQLPTLTINIPLNNKLQALDVEAMDEAAQNTARRGFEPRWNRWNSIRTGLAGLVSALLMVLLFRL